MIIHQRAAGSAALILLGQLVISSCMDAAYAPPLTYPGSYAPGGQSYGAAGGTLSAANANTAQWLAWPQSYDDMIGTFGYPRHRTEFTDYYAIEGTDQWLKIHYSGKTATGYSIGH